MPTMNVDTAQTHDISIWFIFSIEYRHLPKGTIGQEHGRSCEIKLAGVPATEFTDGRPSGRVLEFAEKSFMAKSRSLIRYEEEIFRWEARLGTADGPILSRFDLYR